MYAQKIGARMFKAVLFGNRKNYMFNAQRTDK